MKTKVDKKGKKRSLSETSLSTKPDQKQENITELKKSPKKAKLALVQNGNSTMGNKVQILKKMYKQKEKQKAKQQINIGSSAKIKKEGENKLPIAKLNEESVSKKIMEKKLKNLKKKQIKRDLRKRKRSRNLRNAASITLSIEEIEAKIEEIRNREVLTKKAKKNLAVLNRKLKLEKSANNSEKLNIIEKKSNKKNKQQIGAIVKIEKISNEDNEDKIKVKKEHVQHEKVKIKQEMNDQDDEDESDEDQSNTEKEESMDNANEQFDDESDEDEKDEEDEDAEDDIEKANILKVKNKGVKKMKKQATQSLDTDQKNQHFLYVYNLPLDVTEDELKQHFLTKVDAVSRVVINKSNIKRPPIVAYVWMTNSTDCKKGLLLHHTFLKNKQIIVKMKSNDNKKTNVGKYFASHLPTSQHAIAKNKKTQGFQKAKKLASGNQGKKKSLKKEK